MKTKRPSALSKAKTLHLLLERWNAPICPLLIVTDDECVLRALEFADHESRLHRLLRRYYGGAYTLTEGNTPALVKCALLSYFDGNPDALTKIRTATGGTPFQRQVWNALREIPTGATISYSQLATKIGRAGSSRAVGAANGANPIALVVPCHRVIGADGSLTGYASGLPHKKWLLDHEACFSPRARPL